MKAHDMFELASRNLRQALLRNSLTTVGISVGVASLVAMLSLGLGLQKLAAHQLGRSGLFESIIVSSRQDFRSHEDREAQPVVTEKKLLDDTARASFSKLPGVTEVYPEIRSMVEVRFAADAAKQATPHMAIIAGLPPSAANTEALDDKQGRFFSSDSAEEAIISSEFGRELLGLPEKSGGGDEPKLSKEEASRLIGKQVTLRYAEREAGSAAEQASDASSYSIVRRERPLTIVGTVEREPYGAFRGGPHASVFIPTALAEKMDLMQAADLRSIVRPGNGRIYMALVVRVHKATEVKAVQDAIRKDGYSTFSMLDASRNMTRFFTVLDMFLGIFGSLALVVASLGIVNTLVMTVLERRREIGVMKAIGASDIDVQQLFFIEAGVMGLGGGVLGILLGWAIGKAINFGTNVYLTRQDLTPETFWYVPLWLVFGALGFSIAVSLVSGLYPARRAAQLDPVQALRHD